MKSIENKFDFLKQLEPFIDNRAPVMEMIRNEPQVSKLNRENPTDLHKFIYLTLKELNDSFKVNPDYKLNDNELIEIAQQLIKEYWHYRIQDFAIFVQNAKQGIYGKSYNRLDIPMIWEWIGKYDQDRDKVIEINHQKNKGIDRHERGGNTEIITENPEFRRIASSYKAQNPEPNQGTINQD